ncbi:glutathione S-transferase Y1-like [Glandiceps talaboti]
MPLVIAYWKMRGLQQPIRLLLEYSGIEYEDKMYVSGPAPDFNKDCWFNEKYDLGLDFPNLPYMIDGDVKLTQSNAILRYIARKANLLGTTETEITRVDLITEQAMDVRMFMASKYYTTATWEDSLPELLQKTGSMLKEFSVFLGDNPWFAGQNVSFVDFIMYELMDQLCHVDSKVLDNLKNLKDFHARVETLPAIAAYMKSDRFIKRPLNNPMAKFGSV